MMRLGTIGDSHAASTRAQRASSATAVVFFAALFILVQVTASVTASSTQHSVQKRAINRKLDSSIIAHDWPTFSSSPFCEAFAYIQSAPKDTNGDKEDNQVASGRDGAKNFHQLWSQFYLTAIPKVLKERIYQQDGRDVDYSYSYNDGIKFAMEAATLSFKEAETFIKDSTNENGDESNIGKALKVTSNTPFEINMLRYALATRAHSPTCEMNRNLAISAIAHHENNNILQNGDNRSRSRGAFLVVEGTDMLAVSVDDFLHGKQQPTNTGMLFQEGLGAWATLLPDDQVLFGESQNDKEVSIDDQLEIKSKTAILYGNFDDPSFITLYQGLQANGIPVVVRYMGLDTATKDNHDEKGTDVNTGTVLQGYGVRLDIRNVEYKSFDDKGSPNMGHDNVLDGENDLVDISQSSANNDEGESITAEQWKERFTNGIDPSIVYNAQKSQSLPSSSSWEQLELFFDQYLPQISMKQFITSEQEIPSKDSEDIAKLSLQASMVIAQSKDPLWTMQQLSQNLPSYAHALSQVALTPDFENKVDELVSKHGNRPDAESLKDGEFGFFVNGRRILIERPSFNLFELIHIIREESTLLSVLREDLGKILSGDNKNEMVDVVAEILAMGKDAFEQVSKDNQIANGGNESDGVDAMSAMMGLTVEEPKFRVDVGSGYRGAVLYLNDIEKDPEYQSWPSSMQEALMNMQFGGGFSVRRNVLTALIVVDPFDRQGGTLDTLGLLLQLMQNRTPLRVGIAFASKKDFDSCRGHTDADCVQASVCNSKGGDTIGSCEVTTEIIMKVLQYMMSMYGKSIGLPYLYLLVSELDKITTVNDLVKGHTEALMKMGVPVEDAKSSIISAIKTEHNPKSKVETYSKSVQFVVKKNIQPGMVFVNGIPVTATNPQQLQEVIGEETQRLLGMALTGKITDTSPRSIYAMLLKGDGVHKSMHPLLVEDAPIYKLTYENTKEASKGIIEVTEGESSSKYPKILFEVRTDLASVSGLTNVASAIKSLLIISSKMSNDPTSDRSSIALRIVHLDEENSQIRRLTDAMQKTNPAQLSELLEMIESDLNSMKGAESESVDIRFEITANGRTFIPPSTGIHIEDVELLMSLERDSAHIITERLAPYLTQGDIDSFAIVATSAAYIGNKFSSATFKSTERSEPFNGDEVMLEDDSGLLYFDWKRGGDGPVITAILDPLSYSCQRAAPLLRIIRDDLKLPVKVFLQPRSRLTEGSSLPLTSFYRFVADPLSNITLMNTPSAHFQGLPSNQVLTIRMDVPEEWDIQQSSVVQDTDNLQCTAQSCGDIDFVASLNDDEMAANGRLLENYTTVQYGLDSLLFFGQCYDFSDQSPPNGLQLTLSDAIASTTENDITEQAEVLPDGSIKQKLSTSKRPQTAGTLVMKTVGYWQLRSKPGVWHLQIADGTRGATIYELVDGDFSQNSIGAGGSIESTMTPSTSQTLVMKDFVSPLVLVPVRKKHGFEDSQLLVTDNDFETDDGDDDIVHVFSLATGHLYERFLKIMMLSVTKRTSTKVKFWLFENFLSPTFKASAFAMAKLIGCELEFVTYKWPEWLRAQSEKQRIIWGYKILFLDVLFPLGLKKIIYVDADQVVRGDLKELWELDLAGAPYGYTPMCNSREETKGFRFWSDGFWPNHLRGKPYHISALYVVDLQRFRRELVGDKLRSAYQQLSADPNNLSNLDQDLPNYLQHQIPIKSLPQDWLWCESWCSEESKSTAKTIDLCNNPLHKEAKVSMAKRIISGDLFEESWIDLDAEVDFYDKEYFS